MQANNPGEWTFVLRPAGAMSSSVPTFSGGAVPSDPIVLNVGGERFETTRATLTKYPTSLLGRMFAVEGGYNGPHEFVRDKDGNVFLDRSPALFAVILDFLREGVQAYYNGPPRSPRSEIMRVEMLPIMVGRLGSMAFCSSSRVQTHPRV